MKLNVVKSASLLAAGFALGLLAEHFPTALASNVLGATNLAQNQFLVSIDEARHNVVR